MFTSNLTKIVDRRKKRLGRGLGSGKGFHTVGRGQKGQTSRAGSHRRRGFGSEEFSVVKTFPRNKGIKPARLQPINAVRITKLLEKGVFEIDAAALHNISRGGEVKLVGDTNYEGYDLAKVVIKEDVVISNSLKTIILEKGGKIEVQE